MPLVTPKRLKSVYVLLRAHPPFDRWGLPEVADIKFEILSDEDIGEYSLDHNDRHCIAVNADKHLSLHQVVETVAHEMVHLRQELIGRLPAEGGEKAHNAEFRKLARVVCRTLGFDVQRF